MRLISSLVAFPTSSPIAKAMIGKAVGDSIEAPPRGPHPYEIVSIEIPKE